MTTDCETKKSKAKPVASPAALAERARQRRLRREQAQVHAEVQKRLKAKPPRMASVDEIVGSIRAHWEAREFVINADGTCRVGDEKQRAQHLARIREQMFLLLQQAAAHGHYLPTTWEDHTLLGLAASACQHCGLAMVVDIGDPTRPQVYGSVHLRACPGVKERAKRVDPADVQLELTVQEEDE